MKSSLHSLVIAAVMPLLAVTAFSQSTTFTYQGFLTENGAPANQRYDFIVTDFDAPTGGSSTTSNLVTNIGVTNGLFTLHLDLTALTFPGADRWLEISVRTNGTGGFTPLTPRQRVTSTPYAIRAASAGSVAASNLTGTLAPAQLPAAVVTNGASGITVTGTFTGNGAGLTNLPAWRLGGNAGTTPGVNFIGTTDNQPLEFRVNNLRVMRIEPTVNDLDHSNIVNVINGSPVNAVGPGVYGATISGGGASFYLSFGETNRVDSDFGSIGGGSGNTIGSSADSGTIGGGWNNKIRDAADWATISGGADHRIGNDADYATIGGGGGNLVLSNGAFAMIPGGGQNTATNYAFAAGRRAKAVHTGAFVWADSTDADFSSTISNQFNIRATGGVRVSDNTPSLSFGTTTRQMLNLWSTNFGIGVQDSTTYFRTDSGFAWYRAGSHTNSGPGSGGFTLMTLTSGGLTVNGTFVSASDRNVKEDFRPVNPAEVLNKVLGLPLQEWVYKTDEERSRHLGPMAQDFRAAFGLGADDKHIATVDADGVALAAIQGLNAKVESGRRKAENEITELRNELKRRDAENAELKRELAEIKKLLKALNR